MTENGVKTKMYFDKDASACKFKIGNKVLISNDFHTAKNQKLAPNWKGSAEIIDINYTNAKIKIGNKVKVLNIENLKIFNKQNNSEKDIQIEVLNFNNAQNNRPITHA
jgi:hypothetical protein